MPDVDLKPGSPEWLRTVTASKIPAILGVSRFKSQYALWHEMAGLVDPEPIDRAKQDLFDYGHAAELAAREYWLLRNPGWRASRGERQFSDPTLEFPNAATVDRIGSRGSRRRVVEIKTAKSLEEWGDNGSGEVPEDYAAQVLWQQRVSGFTDPADLVLWPEFGRPRIYTITYEPAIAAAIVSSVRDWLASIESGTPPELDNTISCYETMRRLHPDIKRDAVAQIEPELGAQFLTVDRQLKALTEEHRGLKTRVLDQTGGAQFAHVGKTKIADRRPGKGGSVSLYAATKTDPTTLTKGTAA